MSALLQVARERAGRWLVLTAVALGGSLFFGSSLAHALATWQLWRGALWLTLSAGTGWALLIPSLVFLGKARPLEVIDACLVAMAWGEAVLACGALVNLTLPTSNPIAFNCSVVAVSNVVMAYCLARRLRPHGLNPTKTIALWLLVLDGGGALAFSIFYRVLFA